MYRKSDLTYLNSIFERSNNDIVVIYGDERLQIKDLIREFCKNKIFFYYKAVKAKACVQMITFKDEMDRQTNIPKYAQYDYDKSLLSFLSNKSDSKKLIIFEDFKNILDSNFYYMDYILNLVSNSSITTPFMILIISHDKYWIENHMHKSLGSRIYEFSGVLEIKPFDITECIDYAKKSGIDAYNAFMLYSCIGGNSRYWKYVDSSYIDLKSYIIQHFLDEDDNVFADGRVILSSDIREEAVYNTILYFIANGYNKLNSIHIVSGIERAKLSVYIKALTNRGLIYKCDGIKIGNEGNILKGIYKISDPFVHFWYKFIYPSVSSICVYTPERIYRRCIEPDIKTYLEEYFNVYCQSHLIELANKRDFICEINAIDTYYDKAGMIDSIITTKTGEYVAVIARMNMLSFGETDFIKVKEHIKKNKLNIKTIVIYSASNYSNELTEISKKNHDLILINENPIWIR